MAQELRPLLPVGETQILSLRLQPLRPWGGVNQLLFVCLDYFARQTGRVLIHLFIPEAGSHPSHAHWGQEPNHLSHLCCLPRAPLASVCSRGWKWTPGTPGCGGSRAAEHLYPCVEFMATQACSHENGQIPAVAGVLPRNLWLGPHGPLWLPLQEPHQVPRQPRGSCAWESAAFSLGSSQTAMGEA